MLLQYQYFLFGDNAMVSIIAFGYIMIHVDIPIARCDTSLMVLFGSPCEYVMVSNYKNNIDNTITSAHSVYKIGEKIFSTSITS